MVCPEVHGGICTIVVFLMPLGQQHFIESYKNCHIYRSRKSLGWITLKKILDPRSILLKMPGRQNRSECRCGSSSSSTRDALHSHSPSPEQRSSYLHLSTNSYPRLGSLINAKLCSRQCICIKATWLHYNPKHGIRSKKKKSCYSQ